MRILFLLSQFPAISETFILNQITGLIDRGAEVDILAGTSVPQPTEHPALARYGLLERTRYAGEAPSDPWEARLQAGRLLGSALLRAPFNGTPVRKLMSDGRRDAHRALRFADASRHLGSYDIIQCHFGPVGQWAVSLRNMGLLDGRIVTTFHGYDMCRPFREEGPHVYDRLFAEGDRFLPISDFWRRKLVAHGCPPDRTRVHHMAVDCEAFRFTPRSFPEEGPVRILSVARLVEKKGIEFALRAVAKVAGAADSSRNGGGAVRDVEYTIIGKGPLREELEALAGELGIADSVRFTGGQPSDVVARQMAESHLLLAPSVTAEDGNREGIPVVLMEAMATGLPVISSRHSGIPELVVDGVTGLLAEEGDTAGLADRIRTILVDETLHRRLSKEGRRRVEEEFNIEVQNDRLMQLFRALTADDGLRIGPLSRLARVR